MTDPRPAVLDRNACRSCRRPIYLISNVGWLHGELPQYAHEEIACDKAVPVDPRCPECDALVPASPVGSGASVKLVLHSSSGRALPCPGTGAIVARPA